MKRNLILVLGFLLVLVCAAMAWQQKERAKKLQAQVASLTAEVRQNEADAKEQRELAARLKSENEAYTNEASVLRQKLASRTEAALSVPTDPQAAAPPASPKKSGLKDLLGDMMKDPKMKEMMRQQQAAALKRSYADLVKSRHLTAQQTDQFFDLLMQKQMGIMEEGTKSLNGDEKPEEDSGAMQTAATKSAEVDRQLQMLLGGAGYAEFQDYEKTTGERMALSQVRQQLALNNTPLADEQAKTLLQVMVEERSKTPPSPLDSASGNAQAKLRALNDSNAAEQFYQRQTDINQRILNRAGSILKPDQFSALEAFQKQQLEMQKLGMEMARKMMGDEKDATHTNTVTPATEP